MHATPSAAPPLAIGVDIHASLVHLPGEPLAARFRYTATASVSPLPEGLLLLYPVGRSGCAARVGGSVTSAECTLDLGEVGPHQVEAIYQTEPAIRSRARTAIEVITLDAQPLAISTALSVSDEPFTSPREECDRELIETHECLRELLGRITLSASVSGQASGGLYVDVQAPVCHWFENAAVGCLSAEEWSSLTLYEWAELKQGSPERAAVGLVREAALPPATRREQEGARSATWEAIRRGALQPDIKYLARAGFVTATQGYVVSEPTIALPLLP